MKPVSLLLNPYFTSHAIALMGPVDGTPYTGGTMYAVQQFLESLGVCYLWPGELGLAVPPLQNITVPYGVQTFKPPIKQRTIRMVIGGDRALAGAKDLGLEGDFQKRMVEAGSLKVPYVVRSLGGWEEWQNIGGNIGISGGHSLGDLWDRFGKTHPGWFALQPDGTRNQHNSERAQLCLSNSEVVQQVADDLIAKADKVPGTLSLPLSLNDGGADAFCMCQLNALGEPGCVTYDAPDGRKIDNLWGWNKPYVSLTDRYMVFCNRVAAKVAVKYPKLLLTVDAYSVYSSPPVHTKLNPNLVVRYVPSDMDDWDEWSAKASKIYWRPNGIGASYRVAELKFNLDMAQDLSYAAHHSTIATDFDSIFNNWATEGLNYYVVSKLNWNPDLKPETLIDTYCHDGFGPAAPEIRQYFKKVTDVSTGMNAKVMERYHGDPAKIVVSSRGDTLPEYWTTTLVSQQRALLDAADKKVAGDDPQNQLVHQRIEFLHVGLDWTDIQSRAYKVLIAFQSKQPVDLAAAGQLLTERRTMMKKIYTETPLAINVASLDYGDRGSWQPLQKAIDAAKGFKATGPGDTMVDADEAGRPIVVPKP